MQTFDLEYDFLNGTTLTDKDLPLLMEELKKKLKYGINCSIPITVLINSQQFHLIYHKGSLKFLKDKTKETSDYQQWLNEIEQENWNANRDTPESFHKELSEEQEARNLERQERLEDGKGTGILDKLMPIYSESQLEELKKQQLEQDLAFWNKSNQYQGGEAYKVKSKQEPSVTSHSMVFLDMSNLKEGLSFEEATKELKQRREYPLTPDDCFPGTVRWVAKDKLQDDIKKILEEAEAEKAKSPNNVFKVYPLNWIDKKEVDFDRDWMKQLRDQERYFNPLTNAEHKKLAEIGILDMTRDETYIKIRKADGYAWVDKKEWFKSYAVNPLEIKQPRQKGNKVVEAIRLIWKQLNTKI